MGKTVTFNHSFKLPGMADLHAAGTFELKEESEALDLSWPAYHVTTTVILPTAGGYEAWPISGLDLERLLAEDHAKT